VTMLGFGNLLIVVAIAFSAPFLLGLFPRLQRAPSEEPGRLLPVT